MWAIHLNFILTAHFHGYKFYLVQKNSVQFTKCCLLLIGFDESYWEPLCLVPSKILHFRIEADSLIQILSPYLSNLEYPTATAYI